MTKGHFMKRRWALISITAAVTVTLSIAVVFAVARYKGDTQEEQAKLAYLDAEQARQVLADINSQNEEQEWWKHGVAIGVVNADENRSHEELQSISARTPGSKLRQR